MSTDLLILSLTLTVSHKSETKVIPLWLTLEQAIALFKLVVAILIILNVH